MMLYWILLIADIALGCVCVVGILLTMRVLYKKYRAVRDGKYTGHKNGFYESGLVVKVAVLIWIVCRFTLDYEFTIIESGPMLIAILGKTVLTLAFVIESLRDIQDFSYLSLDNFVKRKKS